MKYRKYLINPFYHDKSYQELIDNNSLIPDPLVFADSGGLQELMIENGEIKSPEDTLLWQEKYTDIGFSLDRIPFKKNIGTVKVGWTFDEVDFEKHALTTKKRIERAMKVRTEYKSFKYYAIIQGIEYEHYKTWKSIIDTEGIDGWCCKSPSNSPANLAETAVYVLQNLDKPVHFLGIGQLTKSIILYYAKRYYKHPFSFDSSSYDSGVQYRRYNLPFYFNGFDVIKYNDENKYDIQNFSEFCCCPACKELSKIIDNPDMERYVGFLISLHNVHQNVQMFSYLENIYKDSEKMKNFVKNYFKEDTGNKILDVFNYIDDAMKHGNIEAKRKWKHIFLENVKTTKQSTLF